MTVQTPDGEVALEVLIGQLDFVVEALNMIPDDADYSGKTWRAIKQLREACAWLTVHRVRS